MVRSTKQTFLLLSCALPASWLGALVMAMPTQIWLTNFGGILIVVRIGAKVPHGLKSIDAAWIEDGSVLLLTFRSQGVTDVHRWIHLGGLHLNVGMIVSPVLLMGLSGLNAYGA